MNNSNAPKLAGVYVDQAELQRLLGLGYIINRFGDLVKPIKVKL